MLSTLFGRATQIKLLEKAEEINCGAIFENAVAQELFAHGYEGYYYANKKKGEVGFLIEYEGSCLPIDFDFTTILWEALLILIFLKYFILKDS